MSLPNVTPTARSGWLRRVFALVAASALVSAPSLTSTSAAFVAPPAQQGSASRTSGPMWGSSRPEHANQPDPGGVLDRSGWVGSEPDGRHHQRSRRRLQPVQTCNGLLCAGQLLALDVEPHDQRQGRRRVPSLSELLARIQASPVRRVNVTGDNLSLMDYCTDGPQFASGRFVADSNAGFVINGCQRQFTVRDSGVGGWSNGVWYQVFSGKAGAPREHFPAIKDECGPNTTLDKTPASREKPYPCIDSDGQYEVFVPAPTTDSKGPAWENGPTSGHGIPLSKF